MSKVIKIICDEGRCYEELEIEDSGDNVFDYGWGQVFEHDEHYCDAHWTDYCVENSVDTETGKDL